jgi:hypothetical protein
MPPFPPEKTFHVFRMPRDAEYADGQWTKMAPLQLIEVRVKGWRTEVRTQFEEMKINSDIELKESLFPRGSIFYIDKEVSDNITYSTVPLNTNGLLALEKSYVEQTSYKHGASSYLR